MNYKLEDGLIFLFGDGTYEQRDLIKSVPGSRWNKYQKAWTFQHNFDAAAELNNLFNLDIPYPSIGQSIQAQEHFAISTLYEHQKKSVKVARQNNYFADFSQPGTGKTLTQIELMLERQVWPVLIIAPKSILEAVWAEQLGKFGIYYMVCEDSTKKTQDQLRNFRNEVFIINYDKVGYLLEDLQKIDWQWIILDESTKIKTPNSLRSKAISKLSADYKSIMTGTKAPNGMLDVFNQVKFLNPELFGNSFYAFRERYFTDRNKFTPIPFPDYRLKPGAETIFKNRMAHCSVEHKKRNCVDLPPLVFEKRYFELDKDQEKAYKSMKEQLVVELKETTITAPFATTKMMKLRQIVSGFIYNAEMGELQIHKLSTSKFSALEDILDEIGDEQVIVFAHFNASIDQIDKWLTKKKYESIKFAENKKDALEKFEKGEVQILLANPASAGHGLNLQFCHNIIYFELDFNLENYEQSIQRIERIGQQNKMTVYQIIGKKTIEEYILSKLNQKIDLNKKLDLDELIEVLQ